jgi:nucleoside-diphosphate-sugar epimerase
MIAMPYFTRQNLPLAGTARAVPAAIRHIEAGSRGGIEDGISAFDDDLLLTWLNGELVHTASCCRARPAYNYAMHKRRLLIVGCGDVMTRALPWLTKRFKVYALARSTHTGAQLRAAGAVPIMADLDQPASLRRLAGIAQHVIHSAPPAAKGTRDQRTRRLASALRQGLILPRGAVYISTIGVYGDCHGELIDETRPRDPRSDRAFRRLDAEDEWRRIGRSGTRVSILRAPGIYAINRLPLERLQAGTPAIVDIEDSFSNHIHADDLAMAACLALFRARPQRCINTCDDSDWKMGEWFDRVADTFKLPRPTRYARAAIPAVVSPALWSFMRESRRIRNRRLLVELRLRLAYPTPETLLRQLKTPPG